MAKFLYKIEKKEITDKIELILFYLNTKTLETIKKEDSIPYSIIMKKEDFERLNVKNDKISLANKKIKNKNKDILIKINIKSQELYKYLIQKTKDEKIETFEADIIKEHQYLINNELKILNTDTNKQLELKYLVLDIETIEIKGITHIVAISTYSKQNNNINNVYINTKHLNQEIKNKIKKYTNKNFKIISFESEKKMLETFKEDIINFKPQMITGWNVIDFDFKIIKEQMQKYKIKFKFSNYDNVECKLRIQNDFFKESTMQCSGILIFDAINLLKINFVNLPDYKLDTAANIILQNNKIKLDDEKHHSIKQKLETITNTYLNNTVKLIEYNFKDSLLVSQILEKLNIIELIMKRSAITNTPLEKIKSPIASLDIMYLKKLHKENIIGPSNFNFNASNQVEGGYVIEPKKAIHNDIFVFDFKSIYPTIIMTFNIDPYSFIESSTDINKINPDTMILSPNKAVFKKNEAILPKLIFKLYKQRDIAKQKNDDLASYAIKITMNSFYGAIGSTKSRFHNNEVAGAITSFARHIIQKTVKFIEEQNHTVIYGDTDSIFVKFNKEFKNDNEKYEFGKNQEKLINDYFENWVKKTYNVKNHLQIEFEKLYSNFFIASKKRYVGYEKSKNELDFKGMEAIRGDWTQLAKNFQKELIQKAFENKNESNIKNFILEYTKKLKEGIFDDKLIYTKKITKPLNSYIKTTPPHVKAAREIPNFTGRTVKYIMTKEGPKHINLIDKKTKYDYEHYINKQLKGVSDDILGVLKIDFDDIVKNKSQSKLNRFF